MQLAKHRLVTQDSSICLFSMVDGKKPKAPRIPSQHENIVGNEHVVVSDIMLMKSDRNWGLQKVARNIRGTGQEAFYSFMNSLCCIQVIFWNKIGTSIPSETKTAVFHSHFVRKGKKWIRFRASIFNVGSGAESIRIALVMTWQILWTVLGSHGMKKFN